MLRKRENLLDVMMNLPLNLVLVIGNWIQNINRREDGMGKTEREEPERGDTSWRSEAG
jgi:hypothetical protein